MSRILFRTAEVKEISFLFYKSSAAEKVTEVEDRRLSFCGGTLRLIKLNIESASADICDRRRCGIVSISDLYIESAGEGKCLTDYCPVQLYITFKKILVSPECDAVVLCISAENVSRLAERDAEPLALTDGVAYIPTVISENVSVAIDEITGHATVSR